MPSSREPAGASGRDDRWDAFVASVPGGHHVQTSRWAEVKAVLGWRARRTVVVEDGRIVAGCQILIRDVPVAGAVAYAPRGPLIDARDPARLDAVLEGLRTLAKRERVAYLKLQPPTDRPDLEPELLQRGFKASALEAAPTATVLVDLARDPEAILASMRSTARRHVRGAGRRGLLARLGDASDLETFVRIVQSTSARQGFHAYPDTYYRQMWDSFEGHRALVIVERDGAPLSALLLIGWNDHVIYKMGGWSGDRSAGHPNELAHWTAMEWSRERGYRFYDLEGIPPDMAAAVLRGEPVDGRWPGRARFKLGLGGEVAVFPGAYDLTCRPLAGAVARRLASPRLRPLAHRVLGRA